MQRAKRNWTFGIIASVPFLMVLGNSMLFPVFPKMQRVLHLSGLQVSLVVTAFSVPAGLLIPLAGYLADRYGRRKVMVPSVALFSLGALLAGFSTVLAGHPYVHILVGRVLQGVGAAGMSQLAMVMTADLFAGKGRGRMLGMIEGANGLGKVISPITGGLLGVVFYGLPFFAFGFLGVVVTLGLLLVAREPGFEPIRERLGPYTHKIVKVFRDRGLPIAAVLASGAVGMFVLFGTIFYLSEVLEKRYGVPELSVGFILALPTAALSVTALLTGMYLQRSGAGRAKPLAIWGLEVIGAVMVVNAFFAQKAVLLVAVSCIGVGGGLLLPALNLLITSATATEHRGTITSLYGGVRFLGVAVGPPVFDLLMKTSHALLFGTAAAVTVATGVFALVALDSARLMGEGGPPQGRGPESARPRTGAPVRKRRVPTPG